MYNILRARSSFFSLSNFIRLKRLVLWYEINRQCCHDLSHYIWFVCLFLSVCFPKIYPLHNSLLDPSSYVTNRSLFVLIINTPAVKRPLSERFPLF